MNIIQIGCFDGNDDVYTFVSQNYTNINKLILVDVLEEKIQEAKQIYSKYTFVDYLNIAIVDDDNIKNIVIYKPKNLVHGQLTSIYKNNISKFFQDTEIEQFNIDCISINQLFKKFYLKDIDRLYIDTEGLDCKIINSIDYKLYNINYIEYEYVHSDGIDTYGDYGIKTENNLIGLGYKKQYKPPFNIIFQK
jgi:FkbM family methyltransferase